MIDSYLLLKQGSEVTEDDFFLACVLGWCVEWVMLLNPSAHHPFIPESAHADTNRFQLSLVLSKMHVVSSMCTTT